MRIAIATTQVPFIRGGAEILVEDLKRALIARGHEAEIVAIPGKSHTLEHFLGYVLACRLFDLEEAVDGPVDLLIGMKFPAYLIPHPNKVIWLIHQYRQAYELWDDEIGLINTPQGIQAREAVVRADRLTAGDTHKFFTISKNVSARLRHHTEIDSTPLYPPPRNMSRFYCREAEDYILFPGRLSLLKRHELVLEALTRTRCPVRLRCPGGGDVPEYAERLQARAESLGVARRIEWLGWLSEKDLLRQYARALGVVFPPRDEDYGYITLEAMLSAKPVITCSDSGGSLEFVVHRKTGLVADPDPESLAAAMDELWQDRTRARRWGRAGRRRIEDLEIGWDTVLGSLLT